MQRRSPPRKNRLSLAILALACFLSSRPAAALEAEIKGADQDRVNILRVKPPSDIDIKKILPLQFPSVDGEMDYLDNDEMWDVTRDLRLNALDATLDGLFAGNLFFSDHEMDKEKVDVPRRFTIFGGVEVYDIGNAADPADARLNDALDQSIVDNVDADTALDKTAGYGGRLGVRWPLAKFADAGFHLGYIHGSNVDDAFSRLNASGGEIRRHLEFNYLRAMVDAGVRIPIVPKFYLRLGVAAGLARASLRQDVQGVGLYAPATGSWSDDATGFSWEISPAFQIGSPARWFEIGARFARFPAVGGVTSDKIKWETTGISIAAGF